MKSTLLKVNFKVQSKLKIHLNNQIKDFYKTEFTLLVSEFFGAPVASYFLINRASEKGNKCLITLIHP